MASVNQFTGSPWHVERMVRADGDPRRHRGKCKYYNRETRYCSAICSNCFGSAHCSYYKEGKPITQSRRSTSSEWKPKTAKVNKYSQYNKKKVYDQPKKKTISVGSVYRDARYGKGVVKSIYNGLAIVNFKNVGDVLIDTKSNKTSGCLHEVEKRDGKYIRKNR